MICNNSLDQVYKIKNFVMLLENFQGNNINNYLSTRFEPTIVVYHQDKLKNRNKTCKWNNLHYTSL